MHKERDVIPPPRKISYPDVRDALCSLGWTIHVEHRYEDHTDWWMFPPGQQEEYESQGLALMQASKESSLVDERWADILAAVKRLLLTEPGNPSAAVDYAALKALQSAMVKAV